MKDGRYTFGVMIGNANSPHAINILKGIKQAALETDVNIITFLGVPTGYFFRDYFADNESYDYQFNTIYDFVNLADTDGIIISYGEVVIFLDKKERSNFLLKYAHFPKIVLENHMEDEKTRYQLVDNYKGMREIVEHLVNEHGYRHFVHLRGPLDNEDAEERARAFMDVMRENNIRITEDMVRVGDFSESVEQEVEYLFDHNPFIQAFVCANDLMANAVYKVCKRRQAAVVSMTNEAKEWLRFSPMKYYIGTGIESGEGIAVTGFDDWIVSSVMDPPLTTVRQNAYSSGYKAVYMLLDLLGNKNPDNVIMPSQMVKRNSCGCKNQGDTDFEPITDAERIRPEIYAIKVAEKMKKLILVSDVNDIIEDKIYDSVYNIIYSQTIMFLGYVKEQTSSEIMVGQLRRLLNGPLSSYISPSALAKSFTDFMTMLIRNNRDHSKEVLLAEILSEGMKYLQGYIYKNSQEDFSMQKINTWFMSLISRDMGNHVDNEREMFISVMTKMNELGIGKSCLFMYPTPIKHERAEEWKCPDKMNLAAYSIGREAVAFDKLEGPVVDASKGLDKYFEENTGGSRFNMTLVNIFSEKTQYGVLAGETDPKNALMLFYSAVQIGTALKYYEISEAQKKAQADLVRVIKEVEEKNTMLSFINEYDVLTGCLNRRGFIERAVKLKNENFGRMATIVFADLDHLKEINDTYGHGQGDIAIKKSAEFLERVIGQSGNLSRFGGDEYVAIGLTDDIIDGSSLHDRVSEVAREFNENSDLPYYVECSVGYYEFMLSEDTDIQQMVTKADEVLYEMKKKRRKSVAKPTTV